MASVCQGGGIDRPHEEASVGQASTIGSDIAKHIFQAHGADASGRAAFRKRQAGLRRLARARAAAGIGRRQAEARRGVEEG